MYFIQQHTHAAKARKTKHRYGRRELAPRNVDLAQSHVVVDGEHLQGGGQELGVNTLSGTNKTGNARMNG